MELLNKVLDYSNIGKAYKQVEFSEFSYGFRKGRSAHQSILQSQRYINEGYQYIIDFTEKFKTNETESERNHT